jgi:hypothetical protein
MVAVVAPRFDLDECNNEREREFVLALHDRTEAGGWSADAWRWDDRVVVAVCPCDLDPAYNCVLRTLPVDFDGSTVSFGPDETHQFATDLDPARAGVLVLSGQPVHELAAAAADWLEREMRRPIVRHEWNRPDRHGVARRRWVLADTGETLVTQGHVPPGLGPPDRVVAVG